jgi:two-component system C4-dicarboxylate transport response regulator DctD
MLTAHGSMETAVQAMKRGAYDYLTKPIDLDELKVLVRKALDARALASQVETLKAEVLEKYDHGYSLVGQSEPMQQVFKLIGRVAKSDITVLIEGESGTGKELIARSLHYHSLRLGKPFVAVNCAAIPRDLLEAELFGFEKGAFTGAVERRIGRFEQAHTGTLFLDEIGEMPLELQAKLLRVIQERAITRLGSNEAVPLDLRFIATSKTDLEADAAAGRFRSDLLYRLNVVTLRLPSLAARREDVPLLFLQLVREAAARYRREEVEVPPPVIADVTRREWPGNVRELRNAADRYVLGLGLDEETEPAPAVEGRLADRVAAFERSLIAGALHAHGGALKPVYEALGISRKTLYEKMQRYGLDRREHRPRGD